MDIDQVLTRGVAEILPSRDGLIKLMSSRKIKLYQGFDPSMPSLHLGNLVGLFKLRQFQKLGHEVIFLIGDFTGMIGDPSDKLIARKKLNREEVIKNTEKWKEQISKVLDFGGENPAKILYNSEWNDKKTFKDLIDIASNFTVQQMIERDMFDLRLKKNEPIYLSEFLYPIAQGIDSLEMEVDLEVGGSDQIFNMLAGRTLLKTFKGREKYVLATKLLVDKDGNKVGKTTGNALFLDSTPENFYAGILSFPDETILPGFELLTEEDLVGLEEKIRKDPMGEKKRLASEIVDMLWGNDSVEPSQEYFETTFQERKPKYNTEVDTRGTLALTIAPYTSLASISDAKRLIDAGAVEIGGKVIKDTNYKPKSGDEIKVGKKNFLKVK
ncbi:tyrosine--tRNA ligase [Candidatus Woesebacteria bacterium RBG_19FT_COMBO_42_9]|uniref:Tyrosine--tRNA ligase n=1 Tax=Candidatus Woesebacteria bacterium RBG_16_42_24 TaxID=1802485 RepID=A0A1F7XK52_9BACT|nr:MAG: tyrosine--tRNA ligase [Candidatus Woesebacteria bacterium RBG_16_42_24]OGM16352.1 MAG: tyrosine--tRNA ligase [Candidatus Woesebacteria bacterium RBG_19FT_COMBO_42_9]OGM67401.1 MAG: tyrosine--tRNA ligase [Candidatus Woesebacteria bacterium RIFCSPLOWO2_01_FULL_43_11]